LEHGEIYPALRRCAESLTDTIKRLCQSYEVPLQVNRVESLFTAFFAEHPVTDFVSAQRSNMKLYAEFFHSLLDQGVFVAPSGYEAWFVSAAHGEEQVDITIGAVERFLESRSR
jgi:glutamate-1-semialdehyde 2,1-aminomutase